MRSLHTGIYLPDSSVMGQLLADFFTAEPTPYNNLYRKPWKPSNHSDGAAGKLEPGGWLNAGQTDSFTRSVIDRTTSSKQQRNCSPYNLHINENWS